MVHWCAFFKHLFSQHSISIGQTNKNQPCQKKDIKEPTPEDDTDGSYQCQNNNNYLFLFTSGTNSRPTHRTLCHTVLSLLTCHPRRNYFPITPPPLPKVCRASPTSHSEVSLALSLSFSSSNPVFEQTDATPSCFLPDGQQDVGGTVNNRMNVVRCTVAALSSGESVTFHWLPRAEEKQAPTWPPTQQLNILWNVNAGFCAAQLDWDEGAATIDLSGFFFFFLQNCLAECKSDWQPVTAEMLQWNVPNASWNDFSVINWHPTMLGSLSRYRDTDSSWHRLLSRKSVIEDLVAKQWPCRPSESTTVRVIIGS